MSQQPSFNISSNNTTTNNNFSSNTFPPLFVPSLPPQSTPLTLNSIPSQSLFSFTPISFGSPQPNTSIPRETVTTETSPTESSQSRVTETPPVKHGVRHCGACHQVKQLGHNETCPFIDGAIIFTCDGKCTWANCPERKQKKQKKKELEREEKKKEKEVLDSKKKELKEKSSIKPNDSELKYLISSPGSFTKHIDEILATELAKRKKRKLEEIGMTDSQQVDKKARDDPILIDDQSPLCSEETGFRTPSPRRSMTVYSTPQKILLEALDDSFASHQFDLEERLNNMETKFEARISVLEQALAKIISRKKSK